MKKLSHLIVLFTLFFCQNSKAQTNIQHDARVASLLKQVEAGIPSLVMFGRKDAGRYVNMAVLDKDSRSLTWFNCYGHPYDSVQLVDNEYEAIASTSLDPFEFYRYFCMQSLAYVEDAESKFRELGNIVLRDTAYNRQLVYNSPNVKTATSTLQKVVAMESLLKRYSLQLYLFDCKSPSQVLRTDSLALRASLAGRMVRQGDTTSYYNTDLLSAASRIVLCKKTPQRMFVYNSRADLWDSVPLKPGKFTSLLQTKEDVFLLYRGWLELQSQEILYARQQTEKLLNRRDTGLYTRTFRVEGKKQLLLALAQLEIQQLVVEQKISGLLAPEKRMVEHMLRNAYPDGGSEISYAPGIGFAYTISYVRGQKRYELADHRGNVMAAVSDEKKAVDGNADGIIDYYHADVVNASDYYPFGSLMPGRTYNDDKKYRYGFNGKENDNEVKGDGNQQDYGLRIYDPRIGKFLSVDPITSKYPELTPYQFASNRPIDGIDKDGKEWSTTNVYDAATGVTTIAYNVKMKAYQGELAVADVNTIFKEAENRLLTALQATADENTVYQVHYDYSLIEKDQIATERTKTLVFDFTDFRAQNQHDYFNGGLPTEGHNDSNSQSGLMEISIYTINKIDIMTKKLGFARETLETLSAIVNHELGHGVRWKHPLDETTPDIAQSKLDSKGNIVRDEQGRAVRSDVPDEVIRNNVMNTGQNRAVPPKKLGDLKNVTKGQAQWLQKVVKFEQKK